MQTAHPLDLHEFEWHDDETLCRSSAGARENRKLLVHLGFACQREVYLPPEVICGAVRGLCRN